ncbi:MAG: MerR family transcriptional regulator [Caldimonas sp.]
MQGGRKRMQAKIDPSRIRRRRERPRTDGPGSGSRHEGNPSRERVQTMNIGDAARAWGVSAKMIRHHEQVGLVPAPARSAAGYRRYGEADVHTLRFSRRAPDLGFSIGEIGELAGLWQNRRRPSLQVKALAQTRIDGLERKAQAMKGTLEHLVRCRRDDERPECPILETLAHGAAEDDAGARAA